MDKISPGLYVVAVSGGVDSMVLLDMVRQQPGVKIVVAHVDHGMRPDSPADAALVEQYAKEHGLRYAGIRLTAGSHMSEATARRHRYDFLQRCSRSVEADGILLAHHQDDMIETAIIALVRGTGWRGLAPFIGSTQLIRPLLQVTKNDIIAYARRHNIVWREDSTNTDERYLRNYIRHTLVPLLDQKSDDWRTFFLQRIRNQQVVRLKIENELTKWLDNHVVFNNGQAHLRRYDFIMMPSRESYELLQQIFRRMTGNSLERDLVATALLFIKTGLPHKTMVLGTHWQLRAESANVIVEPRTP
jgi:tRNA(Ile)-lysidine synthetase-like protein